MRPNRSTTLMYLAPQPTNSLSLGTSEFQEKDQRASRSAATTLSTSQHRITWCLLGRQRQNRKSNRGKSPLSSGSDKWLIRFELSFRPVLAVDFIHAIPAVTVLVPVWYSYAESFDVNKDTRESSDFAMCFRVHCDDWQTREPSWRRIRGGTLP